MTMTMETLNRYPLRKILLINKIKYLSMIPIKINRRKLRPILIIRIQNTNKKILRVS